MAVPAAAPIKTQNSKLEPEKRPKASITAHLPKSPKTVPAPTVIAVNWASLAASSFLQTALLIRPIKDDKRETRGKLSAAEPIALIDIMPSLLTRILYLK